MSATGTWVINLIKLITKQLDVRLCSILVFLYFLFVLTFLSSVETTAQKRILSIIEGQRLANSNVLTWHPQEQQIRNDSKKTIFVAEKRGWISLKKDG